MDKFFDQLEYSFLERLALARVEPFGMHLFEFIHLCLVVFLALIAVRSLFKTLAMFRKPARSDMLDLPSSLRVEHVQCTSCEWRGHLPIRGRKCPACGSDSFVAV